jgi:hypothetical protein
MAKRKRSKGQTIIYKTLPRNQTIEQHVPPFNSVEEHMCSVRVNSSCSRYGTRPVTLAKNAMISHV